MAARLKRVTGVGKEETVERQEWGKMQRFQGKVYVGKGVEAQEVTSEWKGMAHTVRWRGLGLRGGKWGCDGLDAAGVPAETVETHQPISVQTRKIFPAQISPQEGSAISAGGATAASDSRDSTCLSNTGPRKPRSKNCGKALARPGSESTGERRPSGCFPTTGGRLRPFCSFCETRRSGGW